MKSHDLAGVKQCVRVMCSDQWEVGNALWSGVCSYNNTRPEPGGVRIRANEMNSCRSRSADTTRAQQLNVGQVRVTTEH